MNRQNIDDARADIAEQLEELSYLQRGIALESSLAIVKATFAREFLAQRRAETPTPPHISSP